ncbi:MAG: hypothetical protein RR361_03120 [Anaerovorax sp.]
MGTKESETGMIRKKILVFLITFLGVCGILAADSANSAMVGREPFLSPNIRKVGDGYISIDMMGQNTGIDVKKVEELWDKLEDRLMKKEEINYEAFKSHIL